MKKLFALGSLFYVLIIPKIHSQNPVVLNTSSVTQNIKSKSDIIYASTTTNNELVCIKERSKKLSSKANYTIYHYNTEKQLINTAELNIKKINKIFVVKDSIFLIRYKKIYTARDPAQRGPEQMFAELENVDYSYHSASLNDLEFKEHHWFSIKKGEKHWDTQPENYQVVFKNDESKKKLLHISSISYEPNKEELDDTIIKIIANDSLERTKHYSLNLNIDILNEYLQKDFSKKLIITNNIGEFYLEKYKAYAETNSVYLLLSTYDKKKKKLITFKNKIDTKFHLLKISPNGIEYKTIEDTPHSLATVDMCVFEDQIICAGMYSDTNGDKINGFFRLEFDKNSLEAQKQSYLGFSEQFLSDFKAPISNSPKRGATKNSSTESNNTNYRKLKSLSSDYIHIDKNGDCIINIEEYEILKNNSPGIGMPIPMAGGFTFSISINVTNPAKRQRSIIAAKISKNHQLIWSRGIKSKENENLFYISKSINGINYIIKDDIPRTHNQYNENDPKDYKNDYLFSISINQNGEINSHRFSPHKSSTKVTLLEGQNAGKTQDAIFVHHFKNKVFQVLEYDIK